MNCKRLFLPAVLLLCFTLTLTMGCRKNVPAQDYSSPVPSISGQLTREQVKIAIVKGATLAGWTVMPISDGEIEASVNVRAHKAVVSIPYDQATYSIRYKSSVNLEASEGRVHPNYNRWVARLDEFIKRELVSAKPAPQETPAPSRGKKSSNKK